MPDTLTHSELISYDAYGTPTFGSPATITCRLTYEPTKVLNANGEEVVSKATAWTSSTDLTVDTDDAFVTSFGETLYVMSVNRIQDEDGVHHIKIMFR